VGAIARDAEPLKASKCNRRYSVTHVVPPTSLVVDSQRKAGTMTTVNLDNQPVADAQLVAASCAGDQQAFGAWCAAIRG